jgi:hypothetical protein
MDKFEGCKFLANINRVRMPDGSIVDQKRFNIMYGGVDYVDPYNGRKRKAWRCFTWGELCKRASGLPHNII